MALQKRYSQKAKVWVYPGLAGWHFVTLDKKVSADIRAVYKTGFVKIEACIGKTTWQTSLFPHKDSESYLLCVKAGVRKAEGVCGGDEINLSFKIV